MEKKGDLGPSAGVRSQVMEGGMRSRRKGVSGRAGN